MKLVKAGYTIVELLVSLSLLIMIMVSVTASFLPLYEETSNNLLKNMLYTQINDFVSFISDDIKRACYNGGSETDLAVISEINKVIYFDQEKKCLSYVYKRNEMNQYRSIYIDTNNKFKLQMVESISSLPLSKLCRDGEDVINNKLFKVNEFLANIKDLNCEKCKSQELDVCLNVSTHENSYSMERKFHLLLRNAS